MRNADNENEPFSFQTLAQITARLLRTDEKQNEKRPDDAECSSGDQQRANQHREYVDRRLRDIAAFERRARGEKRAR